MNDEVHSSEELEEFFRQLKKEGVLSDEALGQISAALQSESGAKTGIVGRLPEPPPGETQKLSEEDALRDLRAQIADMGLADKIKLAMLGDGTARMLLVTDTNRLVQQAVMNNPRMRDTEIEAIARNPNVSDFVLRLISNNRTWMKAYIVKFALATNPKTPQDVGIKWLRFLNKNDLRKIARSKNIPQLISITARKQLADLDKRK